jgi:chitin disaccharide deacetylase
MAAEGEMVMPAVRHPESHKPTHPIGQQGMPTPPSHQAHHHQPMHSSSTAPHGNEPADAAALAVWSRDLMSREKMWAHGGAQHSACRAICIAIDDFGLHIGINQAALELATLGHIQAIGCMVGGSAWSGWGSSLQHLTPKEVDVGLHLDLTETPVQKSIAQPLGALMRNSFLGRLNRQVLRTEICLQLDGFEKALARPPAYVDGHQHVHQFPMVRDELLAELTQRYGAFKPWLRSTRNVRGLKATPAMTWRHMIKPWGLAQLGAKPLARMAREIGHPQNQHLLGVYDFCGGKLRYEQLLHMWLTAASHGDLLMCHPSLKGAYSDSLMQARHAEFQVLSGAEFTTRVTEARIQLLPMSQIFDSPFGPVIN